MRLLFDIASGIWESVRETLPATEDEAGAFVAGMAWAFVLFWSMLILATWAWARWHGVAV